MDCISSAFNAGAFHFNNGWRAARGGWGGWGGGWYNDTIIVDPGSIYPVVVAPSPAPVGDLSAWYWCDGSRVFFPHAITCESGFRPVPVGFNPYAPVVPTHYAPSYIITGFVRE
jgi:hypothetical protein